jgi:hypothetical protein
MRWILLLFLLFSCEFRTETKPTPSSSPVTGATTRVGGSFPTLPPLIPIFSESGSLLGKGVPLDSRRIFVTGTLAFSLAVRLATPELAPIPVTGKIEGIGYAILFPSSPLPLSSPLRYRTAVQRGEPLYRYQARPLYEEEETLEVLAVLENFIVVSCPRTPGGYLFTREGEWVPGIFLPDPQGGCPIFRVLPELFLSPPSPAGKSRPSSP